MPDASSPIPNPLNGDLNAGGYRVRNAVPSGQSDHYVTRGEIEAMLATAVGNLYLLRSGLLSMTGALDMNSQKVRNLAAGSAATDAVNKGQLDAIAPGLQSQINALTAGQVRAGAAIITPPTFQTIGDGAGATISGFVDSPGYGSQATGLWTAPTGVYLVEALLIGGGGGGGGGSGSNGYGGGGGGGGAAATRVVVAVTPGQQYAFSVGSGGAGGAEQANGGAGATTMLTVGATSYTAGGGGGGQGARSGGAPAAGGTAAAGAAGGEGGSYNIVNNTWSLAGTPAQSYSGGNGGMAATAAMGGAQILGIAPAVGAGKRNTAAPGNGVQGGGGGGAGGDISGGTNGSFRTGGNGGDGVLVLFW